MIAGASRRQSVNRSWRSAATSNTVRLLMSKCACRPSRESTAGFGLAASRCAVQAGKAIRMAGSITDMTDRRQAASDLFAEKERALVTLASIADGVITTDTDGWVEYLNPVAEELTGWTTETARGLPMQAILRMVDETNRKVAPNPIEMVLREERTIETASTLLLVRNDGAEVPIMQSAAPIRARRRRNLRRGIGAPRRQPRTPVRCQAFLSGQPRFADRPHQPRRIRTQTKPGFEECRATRASPCGDVSRSRPVQGGQRYLRPRRR